MYNDTNALDSVILKEALSYLGIKSPTLANNVGVEYKRIQNVGTGKTKKASGDLASKTIARYPEFSLDWLLTGGGSMLVGSNVSPARTGDLEWIEIPLVPYKACAGWLWRPCLAR